MSTIKKILSIILAILMIASAMPMAFASDEVASGTCGLNGDNLTWTLDSEGTLTISGKGAMCDGSFEMPWYSVVSSIKTIVIENGVTSIGEWAFCSFGNVTSVTIPNSITSIADGAFYDCYSLTSITIPDSVTNIGTEAFGFCTNLTSITIPNSVTSIGEFAFYECYNLETVHYIGTETEWNKIEIIEVENTRLTNAPRHYISLTAGVEPTCTTDGYTGSAYCAECDNALIVESTVKTALGHSFTKYVSDGNATCTADGTKIALCDNGCGAEDEVADTGSMKSHVDADGDGKCDIGKEAMETAAPDDTTDSDVCDTCGKVHENFFNDIFCAIKRFFNMIVEFFSGLNSNA